MNKTISHKTQYLVSDAGPVSVHEVVSDVGSVPVHEVVSEVGPVSVHEVHLRIL